jgi:hypothetical protein
MDLFLADLAMMANMDDVILTAVGISLLAQADDILLLSLSACALQLKFVSLQKWCARNFIFINLIKTIILILGKVRLPHPVFKSESMGKKCWGYHQNRHTKYDDSPLKS